MVSLKSFLTHNTHSDHHPSLFGTGVYFLFGHLSFKSQPVVIVCVTSIHAGLVHSFLSSHYLPLSLFLFFPLPLPLTIPFLPLCLALSPPSPLQCGPGGSISEMKFNPLDPRYIYTTSVDGTFAMKDIEGKHSQTFLDTADYRFT